MLDQRFVSLPVADLEPHPENPNRGDVDAIAESIEVNDFWGAVLAQAPADGRTAYRILAGEHRWRAAQQQGLEEVPVLVVEVDDDRARRIVLADNRTSEFSHRHSETLAELLSELSESVSGLAGTGYNQQALDDLLAQIAPPDLDDLARSLGVGTTGDHGDWTRVVRVEVPLADFGRWTAFVNAADLDEQAAFVALLDAAGA